MGGKQVERRRRECRDAAGAEGGGVWGGDVPSCGEGVPLPTGEGSGGLPLPRNFFLHFHVEMAHFVGILAVNFKFYSMNKTVKLHPNPTDTSEYDAI